MSLLVQRITDYLSGGGLFNPELANHGAVRDLLIACRDALAIPAPEGALSADDIDELTYLADRIEAASGRALNIDPAAASAIRAALAAQPQQARAYREANPLGGPAKVFRAMADAIEAGDSYEDTLRRFEYAEARPSPAEAHGIEVSVGRMTESNGCVTWMVTLHRHGVQTLLNGHQVYSSHIEGRAQYEAAALRHFLGQGPEPDILDFDTDGAAPSYRPLKTSAEGRAAVERFFIERLGRHDFTDYIRTALAADFACVLGGYLAAPTAQPQPKGTKQAQLSITLDTSGIHAELAEYQREAEQIAQAPAPAPEVPAGFKLVPVEPTRDMLEICKISFINSHGRAPWERNRRAYRAMVAAAPEVQAPAVHDGNARDSDKQLMDFYSVESLPALIDAQEKHIRRLQAKLPSIDQPAFTRVREG